MPTPSRLVALLAVLSVLLAAIGNVVSGPVADSAPVWIRIPSLPLLGLVTAIAMGSGLRLAYLQSGAGAFSRRRQQAAIRYVVLGGLLAALAGILSGVTAAGLPHGLKELSLPFFLAVTLLASIVSVKLYQLQTAPEEEETTRRNFLIRLGDRYAAWQDSALRAGKRIPLSFHEELYIRPFRVTRPTIGMAPTQDRTVNSDDMVDTIGKHPKKLPSGATIEQAFQYADGHLLILGEPGAGKTTSLVELALSLVQQAKLDSHRPVPVVLNLSSWDPDRDPLSDWMSRELLLSYSLPLKRAEDWVWGNDSDGNTILPLLDGLDELESGPVRDLCVEAINTFRAEYPTRALVVCSRLAEFRALNARLELERAVTIEPLDDARIMTYLQRSDGRPSVLQSVVKADVQLLDVVRTPLFLHLIQVTYGDLPPDNIPQGRQRVAWRRQLFQDYLERMLDWKRPSEGTPPYTTEEVMDTLTWLAAQMRAQERADFYPRWMRWEKPRKVSAFDPALLGADGPAFYWLPVPAQRLYWLVSMIAGIGWRVGVGVITAVIIGTIFGRAGGLVFGLGLTLGLHWMFVEPLGLLYRSRVEWVVRGVNTGLLVGIGAGMIAGRVAGTTAGVVVGVIIGLVTAVFVGLLVSVAFGSGVLMDLYRVSAAVVILVCELIGALLSGQGVLIGLVLGLLLGTILAVGIGFVSALGVGLLDDLFDAMNLDIDSPWRVTWSVKRAEMLWCLQRNGYVPAHLGRFLEFAADRVLLVKVNNGYSYFHPLLRDYFADLGTDLEIGLAPLADEESPNRRLGMALISWIGNCG